MKSKLGLLGFTVALLFAGVANSATMRVVVVDTSDTAAYVKALASGQELLKKKGSPGELRAWVGTYAGEGAGHVVVTIEYPNLEALAKDTAMMKSDADLHAWLESLGKLRKIVSDSIYEELKP